MGVQSSVLDTVSVRCHVVFLNGWLVAKTGVEGEEKGGDVQGNSASAGVCELRD